MDTSQWTVGNRRPVVTATPDGPKNWNPLTRGITRRIGTIDEDHMNQCIHIRTAAVLGFASILLIVAIASDAAETVRGSGVVTSEVREVKHFTRIESAGSAEVRIERGERDSLTIEAEDNILPLLETTVKDAKLKLTTKNNVNLRTTKPIIFRITARELDGVAISGSGTMEASGVEAEAFAIAISGSGKIALRGRVDTLKLVISGSGSVDALHLPAKTVKAVVNGSGRIAVNAAEQLVVNITGNGSVEYVGNPRVTKRITGSGRISAKSAE